MYTEYFGFREEPFADIADLRFFYSNALYQKAYTTLLAGIREYKGFLLLTGEAGTGKTTILRRVMRDLETASHSLFFDSTSLTCTSIDDLLYFICGQLKMRDNGNGRAGKLRAFNEYLGTLAQNGGTGVLVVDEAHHLSDEVLNGLRMLAPLDPRTERLLLQIILAGQPELEVKLAQPKLRPIQQRIALRCHVERFRDQEVPPYIHHRLAVVGCERHDLFSPEAITQIAGCSKGLPRLINIICDNALFLAHGKLQPRVSAAVVEEVVTKLRLAPSIAEVTPSKPEAPLPVAPQAPVDRLIAKERVLPVAVPGVSLQLDGARALFSLLWPRFGLSLVMVLFLAFALGLLVYGRQRPNVPQSVPQVLETTTIEAPRSIGAVNVSQPLPTISALPKAQTLAMQGGQTQDFSVEVQGSGKPESIEVVWILDGQRVANGQRWLFTSPATDSDRRHTITATVTDPNGRTIERRWTVTVERTIASAFQIVGVRPAGQELGVAVGEKVSFMVEVANSQPDLQYVWLLDGQEQAQEKVWTYEARLTDASQQTVSVQVRGANRQVVERSWKIYVRRVEHPPVIAVAVPPNQTVTIGVGKNQTFSVAAKGSDPGDALTAIWLLDGQEVARGRSWTFTPLLTDESEKHRVTVTVRDRKGRVVEKQWTVSVEKDS